MFELLCFGRFGIDPLTNIFTSVLNRLQSDNVAHIMARGTNDKWKEGGHELPWSPFALFAQGGKSV